MEFSLRRFRWKQVILLGTICGLLFAGLSFAQTSGSRRPPADADLGPVMTPQQQREWLQWNHRRVQRDVRRLVELAKEVGDQAGKLEGKLSVVTQQHQIEALQEKITALSKEFEKTNPDILALGIVGRAEVIAEEARTLRQSFAQVDAEKEKLSRLETLARQIQERSQRVAERLRNP